MIKRIKTFRWKVLTDTQSGVSSYLKTFVGLLLLYYVFQKVGWQDLWEELKNANLYYLTLYICIGFLVTLVSAVKWRVLVEPHGISASFAKLYSLYMVGYLFNNILPTSVGGDAIRAYELGKCEGKKQEALASVFMERFTGLTTLIVLALLAVYLDEHHLRDIRLVVPLGLVLVGYVGIGGIVFNRSFVSFLEDHVCRENVGKMTKKLRGFQEAIYMYQHHGREIIYAIGYSILFYANCVLIVYVGCLVFDVHVSIGSLIMAVPVMFVLCLIPISVGGIGVKEWAYYLVLGMIGVPGSVGLSIALMDRAMVVGFGLLGGAIYPLLKETQKVKGPGREFRTAVE